MARVLIVLGLVILAAGLLWPYLSQLGLGRLPGDIAIIAFLSRALDERQCGCSPSRYHHGCRG